MELTCRIILLVALNSLFINCILCKLCQTSSDGGTAVYKNCNSCCGPEGEKYCCEDVTTTNDGADQEPNWWIVGVCGAISLVVVIVFVAVLLICTKKKMQRRVLQLREMSVLPARDFHDNSFTTTPVHPPAYTREPPADRPPSYRSQRSARRSARYSTCNQENTSRRATLADTCILPSGRPPESGRPPDYATLHRPEPERITTQSSSEVNTQNSSQTAANRNANRTHRLQENTISPPPPYSRHAYL